MKPYITATSDPRSIHCIENRQREALGTGCFRCRFVAGGQGGHKRLFECLTLRPMSRAFTN